jgi:hypothetical protein
MEAVTALKALRTGVADEPESGLRHVSVFMRDFVASQERLADITPADRMQLQQTVHKHASAPSSRAEANKPVTDASLQVVPLRPRTHAGCDVVEIAVVKRTTTVWRRRRTQI